jgi:threonine/homoserine/homoserine lactone efflux protein
MELGAWAALATVFALGAMSPGPSLAVVLRNTMAGGRSQGVATGLGHGLGFGLYAFTAALGIATALAANDSVGLVLKWGGTAILLWLGATFLRNAAAGPNHNQDLDDNHGPSDTAGFVQGFSIAILNPKILAWMLALYAPFVEANLGIQTLVGMGLLGMSIDGVWYVTVATVLTTGDRAHIIDGAMGMLMFVFAGLLLSESF